MFRVQGWDRQGGQVLINSKQLSRQEINERWDSRLDGEPWDSEGFCEESPIKLTPWDVPWLSRMKDAGEGPQEGVPLPSESLLPPVFSSWVLCQSRRLTCESLIWKVIWERRRDKRWVRETENQWQMLFGVAIAESATLKSAHFLRFGELISELCMQPKEDKRLQPAAPLPWQPRVDPPQSFLSSGCVRAEQPLRESHAATWEPQDKKQMHVTQSDGCCLAVLVGKSHSLCGMGTSSSGIWHATKILKWCKRAIDRNTASQEKLASKQKQNRTKLGFRLRTCFRKNAVFT